MMVGSSVKRSQVADLEYWNAPEHILEHYRQKDFGVYAENWDAISLFMRLHTQWNVDGFGNRCGLNYQGVEVAARLSGFDMTPDLFGQIQIMELAMLEETRKNG